MQKISFDFDGVLSEKLWQDFAKQLIDNELDIYIITTRFLAFSEEVYLIAEKVGINKENIFFTEGELKYLKIRELQIDLHFDDNPLEIFEIQKSGKMAFLTQIDWVILQRFIQKFKI
jgi:uncharacterized HAD superfamily protein